MKLSHARLIEGVLLFSLVAIGAVPLWGQGAPPQMTLTEQTARQKFASALPTPQGFQEYVKDGKLELSLADAIKLAMENNTDIQLDESQIETTNNAIGFVRGPFDPLLTSSFSTQRSNSTTF